MENKTKNDSNTEASFRSKTLLAAILFLFVFPLSCKVYFGGLNRLFSRSRLVLVCVSAVNQSARIFCTRAFWLLRHTDEPQRGRNSCLWLQSRSVLSSFGVLLMSCRVNFHVVRSALQYSACKIFLSTFHFCWSGLYRSYVVRRIRLRSFAVLCG